MGLGGRQPNVCSLTLDTLCQERLGFWAFPKTRNSTSGDALEQTQDQVVSYGQGQVDATVDTQLRRLVRMILPDPEPATSGPAKGSSQDAGATAPKSQDDSERDDDSV